MSFLVDGEDYFAAVRAALARAQRSIYILGWDIDSRMRLMPQGAADGYPEELAPFLNAIVSERRKLRAYVLAWDFAMLYAFEREWLPIYHFDWKTHRRLDFRLDGQHPLGASHHQKIVVVDDRVALLGGFDLTRSRWDRSAHACDDQLRSDPNGAHYGPFHDVGAIVEGDCARALGDLARERWQRATGAPPRAGAAPTRDPWPPHVSADAGRRRRRHRAHRAARTPRRAAWTRCGGCTSRRSPRRAGSSSPRTSTSPRAPSRTRSRSAWPSRTRRRSRS